MLILLESLKFPVILENLWATS